MLIKQLEISGLRSFSQANFMFEPGMNLLVGINGVGKTTVLDALRISLSKMLPVLTASTAKKEGFTIGDIKNGQEALQVTLNFEMEQTTAILLSQKNRIQFKPLDEKGGRSQILETPDIEQVLPAPLKKLFPNNKNATNQPIVVFFSTRRSLITDQAPSKTAAAGGQAAAFADALLVNREFNLRIFAQWYKAQEILGTENPKALNKIAIIKEALTRFLPAFSNLTVTEEKGSLYFTVEKAGDTLSVKQLSDGERGMFSLVLDIARRLVQANPELEDPLSQGKGIILIDELDLHLHPKWQRTIVENLVRTFPQCQFIATTHSPQIIGEVKPQNIAIIADGIHQPASSFGVDSGRILEEVLDTVPRNAGVQLMLNELYKDINEDKLENAKKRLVKIIEILGPDDASVTQTSTMIHFLEQDLTDETDK
jgi:predicted ATP-binding protein involved in virulence